MDKGSGAFGGDWTAEKLRVLEDYLKPYTTIMRKQSFAFAYIDAFAGTGYLHRKSSDSDLLDFFGTEVEEFADGSARIALKVKPEFNSYIFIERSPERYKELELISQEFPDKKDRIRVICGEANEEIRELCSKDWSTRRAVMFLDPYGMQVEWATIEAIAQTKAIDLWLLVPLGQAIMRLLKKDGNLNQTIIDRLNKFFGEDSWYERFYRVHKEHTLLGSETRIEKAASFEDVSIYFIDRLRTVFNFVSERPRFLYNSRNNPLFFLCFAANVSVARKIANSLIERMHNGS